MRVELLTEAGAERQQCEREMLDAGIAVPLPHRCAWARSGGQDYNWFLAVRNEIGRCLGGLAVAVHRSRVLPGHLLLRVERLGPTLPSAVAGSALAALVELAGADCRILRVNVELFSRDPAERERLAELLQSLGFSPQRDSRCYARTIAIDLSGEEEAIFASLHATARRHIRAVAKHPVRLAAIDDYKFSRRLTQLLSETMSRTEGRFMTRTGTGSSPCPVCTRISPGWWGSSART